MYCYKSLNECDKKKKKSPQIYRSFLRRPNLERNAWPARDDDAVDEDVGEEVAGGELSGRTGTLVFCGGVAFPGDEEAEALPWGAGLT